MSAADTLSATPSRPPPANPPLTHPRRRLVIPYTVLAVSLLLTFAAAAYVAITSAARDRARFESAVERTQSAIQQRLETYVNLLYGVAGLFAAQDSKVSLKEYQAFIERLALTERYPGIQGIGVSGRATAGELPNLVEQMRREGFSDFAVRPSEPRDAYHAIVFLEPLDRRNRQAIGYDMFTDPTRRAAMERARDTGNAATSGKVTLVQEIDEAKQAGFLIYVPIYFTKTTPATVEQRRQTLGGFVYSPFRADDLLAGIFGTERFASGIRFSVYDGDQALP
ncbi:MAG: CHASE domain-containing protein, partial [Tepidisphaeraceae bacterium]